MNILDRIKDFFAYLVGKRSEVKDMGLSDVFMAKVILDIHRKWPNPLGLGQLLCRRTEQAESAPSLSGALGLRGR